MTIHIGTNRVHKDDLANFEAQCLMDGNEIDVVNKPTRKNKGFLHVNVTKTYVPPKTRTQAVKDINAVLMYSHRVSGSCTQAYMGSMAMYSYDKILNGKTLKEADICQIIEAHRLVFGYLDSASKQPKLLAAVRAIRKAWKKKSA